MQLSCATWSFPQLRLPETVALARAVGLAGVDLGLFYQGALDRARLLSAPAGLAREVVALGLPVPCYFHLFGSGVRERNCADPAAFAANVGDFERVAAFCAAAGIATVFVSPGMVNAGQSLDVSRAESARQLCALAGIARRQGVTLTVEPHVGSNLESPGAVLELLSRTAGLRLTLDYSHFIHLGYRQEEIDALIPHAAHVHLRQARPGRLQERLELGTVNFAALLAALHAAGYDRWLTIEYCHQSFMDMTNVDVLSETLKMRDLVQAFLQAAGRPGRGGYAGCPQP